MANFVAMTIGPVPAAVIYAPLPPLLVMTLTGLYMLARHFGQTRRHGRNFRERLTR